MLDRIKPDDDDAGTPAVTPSGPAPWSIKSSGATLFTRGEAQKFARDLLSSKTYRDSVEDRIAQKTLPPAIEAMLWHYAYGKPVEQVNVNVTQGEDLSTLGIEDLQKRLEEMLDTAKEAAALNDAIPAQYKVG